jgi:hypothetical protein
VAIIFRDVERAISFELRTSIATRDRRIIPRLTLHAEKRATSVYLSGEAFTSATSPDRYVTIKWFRQE